MGPLPPLLGGYGPRDGQQEPGFQCEKAAKGQQVPDATAEGRKEVMRAE